MSSMSTTINTELHERATSSWVRRHPAAAVCILTYALCWLFLVPMALDSHNLLPFHIPAIVGLLSGWMPALAAIIVSGMTGGRAGIKNLFKRLLVWRVNVAWYLVALFLPAAYLLAGVGVYVLAGGQIKSLSALPISPVLAVALFPIALIEFMLFNTEEFAWRGVALPNLQARYGALVATLILGVVHTLWHLPYFFTAGRSFYSDVGLPVFAIWTLALTVIMTYIFNRTRAGLLIPVLLHAANDAWGQLIAPANVMPFYLGVAVLSLIAIILLVVTRSKLAYRAEQVVS